MILRWHHQRRIYSTFNFRHHKRRDASQNLKLYRIRVILRWLSQPRMDDTFNSKRHYPSRTIWIAMFAMIVIVFRLWTSHNQGAPNWNHLLNYSYNNRPFQCQSECEDHRSYLKGSLDGMEITNGKLETELRK